ncbi:MAG: DUF3429 domain-containing protein [Lysobacterales bacterium]|jgi:hypothetical protein
MNNRRIPAKAAVLGYSGLIPFAAAAAVIVLGGAQIRQTALDGFLVYGAVILSFLGGIRWGAASSGAGDRGQGLIFSILPSLWAAFVLWWFPAVIAAWGLMIGFIVMGLADRLYPGRRVAAWMAPLRVRLTLAVVACHLLVVSVI